MRLASCLVASMLMAVVWHVSPVNGENYLRAAGTDTVSGAGRSDNELPKYTSKSGIVNRVSPVAKALRMLSALHGHRDSLKFWPSFLRLWPFDASLEQDLFNQRNLQNVEDGTPPVDIAAAWEEDLSSDLSMIHQRLVNSVLPQDEGNRQRIVEAALVVAESQQSDGTWSTVNYADQAKSGWATRGHLFNLLLMAKADRISPDDVTKKKIVTGIEWWLTNDPMNPNWWNNQISVPQLMGDMALILGDALPDAQRTRITELMKRSKWDTWTGQNLIWGTSIQVVRGILENDELTVASAYTRMYEEIRVEEPQGEGIMPDASFHQHGSQLYSGTYGLAFARDVGRFVVYSWGTKFQIPSEQLAIYMRYMLDGQRWMVRGNIFDYSATGREITRKGKSASSGGYNLTDIVWQLVALDIPRKDEFVVWADELRQATPGALNGNRYFWCSDYMVQRSPNLMTTVRMYSNRTINTEFVIGDGKRSHHLANGCTFIYRTGEEYRDVFPVWDWNKIPGTTAEHIDFTIQTDPQAKTGADFVGCVSDGGIYGACVQDLQRESLTAKKFWLTFEDAMVAMGVGISCGSDKPIVTTINQALLRDMPTRTGNTIWHDGISYIVLDEQVPQMMAGPQSGQWSDIGTGSDEPLTSDVMTLWLDHGVKPQNASYAYFVLLDAEEASNIKVLANTPDLQAVLTTKLNLLAAAFWKVGTLDAGDLKIEVDQPCMVLARNQQITVSNPRNQPLVVNLKVNGIALTFDLPAGVMAGSSITQELPLMSSDFLDRF